MAGNNIHSQITDQVEIHVPKGFTEAPNRTGMIKNSAGQLQWVDLDSFIDTSNLTATVDPTAFNDSSQGYTVGSRWCNTVQKNMFMCVDASLGGAIWRVILKVNPAGTIPPTIYNDASEGYKEGSVWIVQQSGLNQVWICADSAIGNAEWEELITGSVVGIDHNTLSHLVAPADDHTQYLHIDGRRAMTGNLDMGNESIVNALQINGVTIPTANIVVVKQNPGSAEFGSVAAAIASITTASPSTPFSVLVAPGLYTESQIVMKPYVAVFGYAAQSTILVPSNPNQPFIVGADNSSIRQIAINGAVGPSGVLVQYTGNSANASFIIRDCLLGSAHTLVYAQGNATHETSLILADCASAPNINFTTGVKVDSTGGIVSKAICTSVLISTEHSLSAPTDFATCSGSDATLTLSNVFFVSTIASNAGNGVHFYDGATIIINGANITNTTKAIWAENTGAAPFMAVAGIQARNNTNDFVINHPTATGTIEGSASEELSIFDIGTIGKISIVLTDPDGDFVVSDFIKVRQQDNSFVDITTLITNSSPMGLLTLGDITPPVSGFTVTVEAGLGYLQKSDGSLHKVTWSDTPVTVPMNSVQYLYFDANGVLNMNVFIPDITQNILVGRVVTDNVRIILIEESGFLSVHATNSIGTALREGLGAVYSSGSTVSEAGTRTLDVTPGNYFYGERNFMANGATPITFTTFYQDGSGGFINTPGQTVVSNTEWDDGTGTLAPIGAGNYAKHSLYALGDSSGDSDSEDYFLVYSQAQYTALTLAEQGSLPNPPNYLSAAVVLIASIIVQQGFANITEIRDERPISSSRRTSTVAAATFHSNLLGLTIGDDHPQYWRNDGTHVATGDFNLGTHNITNLGTANGVVVENHHARHQPGGADALITSPAFTLNPDAGNSTGTSANLSRADHIHNVPTAAAVTLDSTTTNTQGVSTFFSRADHTHAVTSGTPVTQNTDQANAAGSATGFAKADHIHNIPTDVPTGLNSINSNSQGSSSKFSKADHIHSIAVAAAITQTPNQVNATGVASGLSRSDHIHNIPTGIASGMNANSTNTQGTASAFAQQDHTHFILSSAPSTQTPDQANATGTSTGFARADHIHNIPTATAVDLNANSVSTQGAAASFARADHTHAIASGNVSTQNTDQANSTGTSVNFARADHIHNIPTAIVIDIGSANSQGTSTSFARADHVHKGVHSVKANAGTQEFGDLILQNGNGVTITDSPAGTFTIDTNFGANEFVVTSTTGLQINYTGGRFINGVNGAVANVPSGTITVTANTPLGFLYVAVNNLNSLSPTVVASSTPPGIGYLPFAQYVSGPSTITSITDARAFVNTAPLIHSLRIYYTGAGLVVNYNSSDVRINGVFTTINAGTITLANAVATGAIYVDAGTNSVTANNTGTFPPNCTPLATYTTSGGNVTALVLVRAYINNNIIFGLSADIASLTPNLAASAGSTNKYADAGHIHNIPTAAPANQTIAVAASDGAAATFSRSDHLHTFSTAAPANQTIAVAASDGSATTFSRSDHLHTFSTAAAVAQTPNQANAAGTSTSFARADHVHNIPTAAPANQTIAASASDGSAATFSRSDHLHTFSTAAAISQTPNQANAAGTSTSFARADHVHNIPTAIATTISSNANAQGSAATFSNSDHTHQLTSGTALLDHIPQYDASNWQAVYPEAALAPSRAWVKNDEFLSNSGASATIIGDLSWTVTLGGGGSTVATSTAQLDSGHPGIIRITAGSAGANTAGIILNSNNILVLDGGAISMEWVVQVVTLATITNDYSFRCGIGDSATADFTNGVYFEYTRGTNTNWLIKTANGGTRTSTSSGVAVAGGSWVRLGLVVNAAGTSISYTINGSSVGTITTNIPTGGTSFAANQTRTAGTPVGVDIDYFSVNQRFTTAR